MSLWTKISPRLRKPRNNLRGTSAISRVVAKNAFQERNWFHGCLISLPVLIFSTQQRFLIATVIVCRRYLKLRITTVSHASVWWIWWKTWCIQDFPTLRIAQNLGSRLCCGSLPRWCRCPDQWTIVSFRGCTPRTMQELQNKRQRLCSAFSCRTGTIRIIGTIRTCLRHKNNIDEFGVNFGK